MPDGVLSPYSGGFCPGVPPLPIPNREVKPGRADGTAPQCGRVGRRPLFHMVSPPCLDRRGGEMPFCGGSGRRGGRRGSRSFFVLFPFSVILYFSVLCCLLSFGLFPGWCGWCVCPVPCRRCDVMHCRGRQGMGNDGLYNNSSTFSLLYNVFILFNP